MMPLMDPAGTAMSTPASARTPPKESETPSRRSMSGAVVEAGCAAGTRPPRSQRTDCSLRARPPTSPQPGGRGSRASSRPLGGDLRVARVHVRPDQVAQDGPGPSGIAGVERRLRAVLEPEWDGLGTVRARPLAPKRGT